MNQPNESKHARQTETALTADGDIAVNALGRDDRQTHELGRLIRESANVDQPEPNDDLRQQLMEQLENAPATEQNEYAYTDGRLRRWAIAASLLLALGVCSVFLLDRSRELVVELPDAVNAVTAQNLSLRVEPTGSKEGNIDPSPEPPASGDGKQKGKTSESTVAAGKNGKDSGVKYRIETRTRTVPVMRKRLETRTRMVPVQRIRKETRTRKLPDGSSESYQVSVPYTDQVLSLIHI